MKTSFSKKLVFITLSLAALLALFCVSASAEDYGNLSYSKIEPAQDEDFQAYIEITGYNSDGESTESVLVIPSSIEDIPVTRINASALSYISGIEEVILPDSIESIENSAFFESASLKLAVIPDSVKYIGESAFQGCTALETVIIGDGVEQIDSLAFKNCSALVNVRLGSAVKEIGSGAFFGCTSLKSVVIPQSVTEIDTLAFGCVQDGDEVRELDGFTFLTYGGSEAVEAYIAADSVSLAVDNTHKECDSGAHTAEYSLVRKATSAYEGLEMGVCSVCGDVLTQPNTQVEPEKMSANEIASLVIAVVCIAAIALSAVVYVKRSKKRRAAAIEAYNAGKPMPDEDARLKELEKKRKKEEKKRAKQEAALKKYEQ